MKKLLIFLSVVVLATIIIFGFSLIVCAEENQQSQTGQNSQQVVRSSLELLINQHLNLVQIKEGKIYIN